MCSWERRQRQEWLLSSAKVASACSTHPRVRIAPLHRSTTFPSDTAPRTPAAPHSASAADTCPGRASLGLSRSRASNGPCAHTRRPGAAAQGARAGAGGHLWTRALVVERVAPRVDLRARA